MPRTLALSAGLVAVALSFSPAADAGTSCFGPDRFDGPCCSSATPFLPTFPAITQTIRYVGFDSCVPRVDEEVCAAIGAPHAVTLNGGTVCGVYAIPFTIRTCGPTPQTLWSGTLRAQYARNWFEAQPPSTIQTHERWRLLLNGDLTPSPFLLQRFGGAPAVVPPCRAAFGNRVHFWGFIDYTADCVANGFQAVWALNHDCDFFEHGAAAARAGTFHPSRSYDFIGPSASFQVLQHVAVPTRGTAIDQTCRPNAWQYRPNICLCEEAIGQRTLDALAPFCPCNAPGGALTPYVPLALDARGQCGSQFRTVATDPIPFNKKLLGAWTDPSRFPGPQNLFVEQGTVRYVDGCLPGQTRIEYFKGVATSGGFPASNQQSLSLPAEFHDVGSANASPTNRTSVIGAPYVTFEILSLNL